MTQGTLTDARIWLATANSKTLASGWEPKPRIEIELVQRLADELTAHVEIAACLLQEAGKLRRFRVSNVDESGMIATAGAVELRLEQLARSLVL